VIIHSLSKLPTGDQPVGLSSLGDMLWTCKPCHCWPCLWAL